MDRRRFIQVAGTTAAGATLLSRAEAQAPRRPQPEGEVLRLDATSPHGEPGRRNVYYAFADLAHTIEPGDMLEYDIFVREDSPAHSASVDIRFTEGPYFRESQIQDQDGIPCHPAASLDRRAQGKWHRRRFDLTPLAGRTTGSFELAFANDVATEGTYVVFLDNVRIVRDGQIAAGIWSEGPPDPASLVGSAILTDISLRTVTLDAMDGPPPPLPVAEVALTAAVPFTTTEDGYAEAPLVAAGRDGFVAATVLRLPSRQDQVAAWTESGQLTPLTAEPGAYDSLCAAGDGEHFAFCWVRNAGDRWTLDTHIDGVTEAIPETGPGRCANPALDVRGDMGVAVAYEVYHEGGFHVRLVRGAGAGWDAPIDVAEGHDPSVSIGPDGTCWIAYTRGGGEKNVYLSRVGPDGSVGKEIPLCTGGERLNMCHAPDVLALPSGDVWIAWERTSPSKRLEPYFGMMEVWTACLSAERLLTVEPRGNHRGQRALMNGNYHQPKLATDDDGRLWLFARQSLAPRRTWQLVACLLDGDKGWTHPAELLPADALGRLSPVTVAMSPGGPAVAWQVDNVLVQGVPARDWFSSAYVGILNLPLAGDGAEPRLTAYEPAQPGHPPELPRMDYRPTVTHGGEDYTVLYGNLHEHTNFSRCWADGSDGTLDDNYRYGIEVMGYDFVGMTDHGYDLVELRWERTIRASRFYRDTPYFVGIPGFEWTLSGEEKPPGSGHRNVFFGGDDQASRFVGEAGAVLDSRLTEASNMPDKVWRILREQGATAVTIPHHTADKQHPIDWDYHDDEYQCVAEIFQARQSCEHAGCPRETPNLTAHEGCYLQDGLARGHRFGFIASGDHNSMGQGIAAVLVKEISLEGILEALRARRCFATTGAKILMDFRVDDMVQGEEGPAGDAPRIQATIDGTAPLTNVVVFRSNEVIYELTEDQLEGRRSLRLDFEDEGRGGSEFYYARAIQADNEIAWSSPVWVDA